MIAKIHNNDKVKAVFDDFCQANDIKGEQAFEDDPTDIEESKQID